MVNKIEADDMDPITRGDLVALSEEIKGHIDLVIEPVKKEQDEHRTILTGASRMNGLVGKVKTLGANLKVIYGLLAFLSAVMIKKYMF